MKYILIIIVASTLFISSCGAISGTTKNGKSWIIATPFTKSKLGDREIDAKIIPTEIILK